jgi:peptidoglycan/LPS O-acetylase OafA/YrhL
MRKKNIHGLRGLAALTVTFGHFISAFAPLIVYKGAWAYPHFLENKNPSLLFQILTSPICNIFYNGPFAVLVFFVLSGYVLTIPYFKNNRLSLQQLLWGRYIRLSLPMAASIALSFLIYKLNFYSNFLASDISGSSWLKNFFPPGITLLTALKEASFSTLLFGKPILGPQLWTLRIEFIGSIYLLLFYLFKPQQKNILAAGLIMALLYFIHGKDSIYFMAIFFGSYLTYLPFRKNMNRVIFILGFYFGAFQFQSCLYDFLPSIQIIHTEIFEKRPFYNTIGAVLITASIINGTGRNILESKIFQFLGNISFSLYLLHFMILCSLSCSLYLFLPHTKIFLLLNLIVYILFCFVSSKIFELYIDKKAIKLSHQFSHYILK